MNDDDLVAMKKKVQRLVYIAAGGKIKRGGARATTTPICATIGLDSLGYLNLLEGLERTFGVAIDLDHEEDHSFLHTIDNIVRYVVDAAGRGGVIDRMDANRRWSSRRAAREHVESLMAELPAPAGLAVVEHLFGVLPLVAAFFAPRPAIAELASGLKLGALGLFTPTPEPGWAAATVEAEARRRGVCS